MKWIAKVLSIFKWLVISLVCLEIASCLTIAISESVIYRHLFEGQESRYDPYTVYLPRSGNKLTLNNSVSPDPTKNRIIWMFGGSTMWGNTNESTIPTHLSKILNSEAQPLHFTLFNFGVPGYNSLLESKFLHKLLIESDSPPDFIVFYDGANDASYFGQQLHPYAHHGRRRLRGLIDGPHRTHFLFPRSFGTLFYTSYAYELYDKFRWVTAPIEMDSPVLKDYVRLTEYRYDFVDKVASCFGAGFLVFWQPIRWEEDCHNGVDVAHSGNDSGSSSPLFATMRHNFKLPYRAMKKRLKKKPYFIDLSKIFCGRKGSFYGPDGVHLEDEGKNVIARGMAEVLKKIFLTRSEFTKGHNAPAITMQMN